MLAAAIIRGAADRIDAALHPRVPAEYIDPARATLLALIELDGIDA